MRKFRILLPMLLLILLAVPVFAAPNDGTLTVGQTVVTDVSPGGAEEYFFTPAESGEYAFCLEETGANFQSWVCLDDGVALPERYYVVAGWEGKVFSLTAGKTYTLRVTHDTGFGGTLPRKLRLEKVTATTSLSLRGSNEVYYPGEEAGVDPVLSHPGAVSGNFQWSSSNPSVARIEDTGSIHAAVMPVAPGTTTITLTVDGLTASYDFVVADYPQVPIGGSLDVTMQASGRVVFTVTPTQTGRYAIWHQRQLASLTLVGAGIGEPFTGFGDSRGVAYSLKAGVTYYGYLIGYPDEVGTVQDTLHAEPVRPVESVQLQGEPGILPEGFRFFLEAQTDPVYGVLEGVQWSCSDPDVLKLEHMDSNSAICEAVVLKEGTATVTVTVGGISASWEYGLPYVPEWQLDPALPQWTLGVTTTMPILKETTTDHVFYAQEDGYYRLTVKADQDTFVTVSQGDIIGKDVVWHNAAVAAGEEVTIDLYLHKDRYYRIQNSGSVDGGGALTGRVERLQVTDKPVERIEIVSFPIYEFKDDDYGETIDGKYAFSPFRAGSIPSLEATVFYTDGTSATFTQDQLVWDVQSEHGLPGCTWNGIPVELCLLLDGSAPADSIFLSQQGTVTARLRYMGVSVDFPMDLQPAHEHVMAFNPQVDPTPLVPGEVEHYRCFACGKAYADEKGEFRIREEDLILEYKNEFIVDENQVQDIVQQAKPGENIKFPVPEEMTHVVLPPTALQEIVNKESTLEISLGETIVRIDPAALAAILSQGGDAEVTLQVQQVNTENLKEPQKQALVNRDVVYILSAKIFCGSNSIHDFGGGTVTVEVPFNPEPGVGYQVIYVADDGTVTTVPSTYDNGFLRFSTGHFSEYAIVKDPTAPPMQSQGTQHGDLGWLIPVAAVVIGCGAVALLIWKRRKK